ncbi:MAG: hypothetical protein HPY89_03480 [Pelotomaculum sp.]|uniref:Hypothetical membrane protein n=1 Tax=Pelotomaculum thermopropionicum (strain DSM 13744 / JCM 10971 / SI) TaxID=370438 RepID=A5D3T2_PELTS|nr:hypothetical protein [Pelotomaculum sp.]BAF59105.1 hypothetical membrane protein [Pelotomaculum thermopropionicum SI]
MDKKKILGLTLVVMCFFVALLVLTILLHFSWAEPVQTVQAGLLCGSGRPVQEKEKLILAAYEQVLTEEGFPYRVVTEGELAGLGAAGARGQFDALIVPEYMNSAMPPEIAAVIDSYARDEGGCVLLSLDPATRNPDGTLRQEPLLAALAGVRYCLAPAKDQVPMYFGYWCFASPEEGREWGITPGKLDQDNAVSSYSYGRLKFEHARAINMNARVVAFDNAAGTETPVITEKQYDGGGTVIYVNMPIGRYKLRSDDLTLRSVLRTFLIKYARLPRLVNTPGGKGGIVFNLHICSGAYFRALAVMMAQGLFQSELPFSIHITAGPDTYKLGDGMGFFAESMLKGRPVLEVLQNFGKIGSHGGWMHNFFAYNLKYLPQEEAFELIDWNFRVLEAVTGEKVEEYSAPGGEHPFWVNPHLEELGVKAYYYAGDSGSSPTHPRLDGKYAGQKMWAFPITPYRQFASLEEMERGHVPVDEVRRWFQDLIDFSAEERVIRMIYTHPSDTRFCLEAFQAFEEKALLEQREGKIRVASMSEFADFLSRYSKTTWQVRKLRGDSFAVDMENPEGLKDITVALYVGEGENYVVLGGEVATEQADGWLYLTVTSDRPKKHLEVHRTGF